VAYKEIMRETLNQVQGDVGMKFYRQDNILSTDMQNKLIWNYHTQPIEDTTKKMHFICSDSVPTSSTKS